MSPSCVFAVRNKTGAVEKLRMARQASTPSSPGIIMSIKIKSYDGSVRRLLRASSPEDASVTWYPRFSSKIRSNCRMSGSSSTAKIRMLESKIHHLRAQLYHSFGVNSDVLKLLRKDFLDKNSSSHRISQRRNQPRQNPKQSHSGQDTHGIKTPSEHLPAKCDTFK